jgi:hypothetical protein
VLRESPIFLAQQFGMMNRNVAILPKEGRPPAGKRPDSSEPTIDKRRRENRPMRMVVKVDADVDSRDPSKRHRGSQDKGDARPNASDACYGRVAIEPKRACVRGEANDMKDHAVPVLRMAENLPARQSEWGSVRSEIRSGIGNHSCLRAAPTAMMVPPKLIHGPQSAVPKITTIAQRGKNDLPRTKAVPDNSDRNERSMLRSFPLKLSCALCVVSGAAKNYQCPVIIEASA